ncbi:MAG: response regulator [Elusimicrobiota bacterium]
MGLLIYSSYQLRVLIVEDEKNIGELYKDKLMDLGYEVDVAETGLSAIDYMKNTKPDLVILDVNLPDINGVKVLQQLKHIYPNMPVIMYTAYGQFEEYYAKFTDKEIEFYSYLTKPVKLDKLVIEVKKAIGEPCFREQNEKKVE